MNHYQLTIDNLAPVTFWANNSQLKYRLHSAYITFNHKHQLNKTLLYIHHPVQGWCQVCDTKNCYPTISNPLKLDYNKLIMAILHTLAQTNQLPNAKQKQQRKEKALQVERNINAQIQRRYFYIVKSAKDT